jgi:RNA polymerase sigma-70 factor, ECF subfamily
MAQGLIASLSSRQREILVRFYVEEQSVTEICTAMDLTETQFRLLKSQAKARLAMKCGNKLSKHVYALGAAPR